MSPIEIFVDGKPFAKTGNGIATINLPKPGGEVSWFGDEISSGIVTAAKESVGNFFELNASGEQVNFEIAQDLSAVLFPFAKDSKMLKISIIRK